MALCLAVAIISGIRFIQPELRLRRIITLGIVIFLLFAMMGLLSRSVVDLSICSKVAKDPALRSVILSDKPLSPKEYASVFRFPYDASEDSSGKRLTILRFAEFPSLHENTIMFVDLASRHGAKYEPGPFPYPFGPERIVSYGDMQYFVDWMNGRVYGIPISSNAPTIFSELQDSRPVSLDITSDGKLLVVLDENSRLYLMDPKDLSVLALRGIQSGDYCVRINNKLKRIYVSRSKGVTLSSYALEDLSDRVRVNVGFSSWGMAVDEDRGLIYLGRTLKSKVEVRDAYTLALRRTISVESGPRDLALSADGSTLYVACYFAGSVLTIDASTGKIKSRHIVGPLARGIHHSKSSGHTYSCSACGVFDIAN